MAYDKIKDENYNNLKGINVKISTYVTGEGEVLDIRNYTFVRPGSFSSRPGVEKYYTLARSTYTMAPTSNIEYVKNSGASFKLFDSGETLYVQGNTPVDRSLLNPWYSPFTLAGVGLPLDNITQNDYLFYCNGRAFHRFDGTFAVEWNVTDTPLFVNSASVTFSTSLIPVNGVTAVIQSGSHYFALGGHRNTVSLSTVMMGSNYQIPDTGAVITKTLGATINAKGRWLLYGFLKNTFAEYGVSTPIVNYAGPSSIVSPNFVITPQGSTALSFGLTTFGGVTQSFVEWDHFTLGVAYDVQRALNIYPKYLETYNNMLFMGNFPGVTVATPFGYEPKPSTVYFSEVGLPEHVDPANFFEVRTGNGDKISGMSVFQDSLIIFKEGSVHELVGTSPDSLTLRDVTLEYGCLSGRGIATFENLLWFIDRKGIVQYDGANIKVVSDDIEPLLDTVDKTQMIALHVKNSNQVWFGSSNLIFVYDYVVGSFTIYDRLEVDADSGAQVMRYGATLSEVTYWQTGQSYHEGARFGMSLFTDFGQAITLSFKSRYHKRLGDSTQELWRRLFINNDIPGATQGVTINFYPDYGSSIYLSRSVYLDQFQERIDYGVSAKSMSIEVIMQASQPIRFNGYTIESRYLRNV